MNKPIKLGIIGAGYWGRNYVRNFQSLVGAELCWVCDLQASARKRAQTMAPHIQVTDSLETMLADPVLDAVVVATNANLHHLHVMAALKAGKHVLVEKPMATQVKDALEMVTFAKKQQRLLMVGHLMIYHPAITRLAQMIATGELGAIYYLYALRVNLGQIRSDENALWSFAPHDLSIIRYLLKAEPIRVWARGECYLQPNVEDVVFVNLQFPNKVMAQIQLSWLDPHKERRLTVVGEKKMVVFDDNHASEKLKIYDKGVDRPPEYSSYGEYLSLRNGDIHIPHLGLTEPLAEECQHFVQCLQNTSTPLTNGEDGLQVVKILDAAQRSMHQGGIPINL